MKEKTPTSTSTIKTLNLPLLPTPYSHTHCAVGMYTEVASYVATSVTCHTVLYMAVQLYTAPLTSQYQSMNIIKK